MRLLKIMIPWRAGHFSTLLLPAKAAKAKLALARSNSRLCGRSAAGAAVPRKISNARFRDMISKLRKDLIILLGL
jgi:hypothetical protein